MRSSWLYLAMRSLRLIEPVLIWPALVPTAMSAMVESSVSPERWLITAVQPARLAISIAAKVSVRVPIWLILIRIELATRFSMPSRRILVLVTNRSSPTSCTFEPRRSLRCFQPSQSPSCMPSSMLMIGYLSTQVASMSVHSGAVSVRPSPSRWYLPSL